VSTDPLMGEIAGPGSGPPLSGPGVTPPTLSGAGRRFLSDIFVELDFVSQEQAEEAVEAARNPGQTPEKVLLESGAITEDQLARALAERYGLDHIDLTESPVDTSAAALLRQTAAKRYMAAPVGFSDDGALILAVSDPADSLGLSDIAVMTKLAVRPAVAARSQIAKLVDTLSFMVEPTQGASESVSTVIIPPDGDAPLGEPAPPEQADDATAAAAPARDGADERELARLREELAMALVERDQAKELEEALSKLKLEHERALAAAEATAEEALRAERASAQQALSSLRAKQEETLEAERTRRVDEVEAERARTAATLDTERERHQKELEALRGRLTEELEAARAAAAAREDPAPAADPGDRARIEELERELAQAREQVELTADADRRAETARAAHAALREESERQAQVHALTERELRAELEQVRGELERLGGELESRSEPAQTTGE
jgi:Type II secretion system (T2SS), protein E, N-terminal domain